MTTTHNAIWRRLSQGRRGASLGTHGELHCDDAADEEETVRVSTPVTRARVRWTDTSDG